MATKKKPEKTPEKKPAKMEKPKPVPCTCKRLPVVSKVKGGAWICGCSNWMTCDNSATSGRWATEAEAVEEWNRIIAERKAKKKEAKKK